jgi:hypothetical protein
MEKAEIDELLHDSMSWTSPGDAECKKHFLRMMRGRIYGDGPLRMAWEWFRHGWFASENA